MGLVVGAITGAVSLANGAELADKCPAAVCSEELRAEYDDGVMLAHVATAAFVVGGVGVAFGVASLLATDEADESGAGRVEIRLGPAGASLGMMRTIFYCPPGGSPLENREPVGPGNEQAGYR